MVHPQGRYIGQRELEKFFPDLEDDGIPLDEWVQHDIDQLPPHLADFVNEAGMVNIEKVVQLLKIINTEPSCALADDLSIKFNLAHSYNKLATVELIRGFLQKTRGFEARQILHLFFKLNALEDKWVKEFVKDCVNENLKITDLYKIYEKYGKQFRENEILTDVSKLMGVLFSKISFSEREGGILGSGFTNSFKGKFPTSNPIRTLTLELINTVHKRRPQLFINDILEKRYALIPRMKRVRAEFYYSNPVLTIDPQTFTDERNASVKFYDAFCKMYTFSSISLELASRDVLHVTDTFAHFNIGK